MPKKSRRRGGAKRQPAAAAAASSAAPAASASGGPPANSRSSIGRASTAFAPSVSSLGRQPTREEVFQSYVDADCADGLRALVIDGFIRTFWSIGLERNEETDAKATGVIVQVEKDLYAKASSLQEYANLVVTDEAFEAILVAYVNASDTSNVASRPGVTDSATLVAASSDDSGELWPYEKRFDLLQAHFTNFERSCMQDDADCVMKHALGMLALPYYQIGDLRACTAIIIGGIRNEPRFSSAFSRYEDRLRHLLKALSHDQREHPFTRIRMLMLRVADRKGTIRSMTNYTRRILHIAKAEYEALLEFPSVVNLYRSDGSADNLSPLQFGDSVPHTPPNSRVRALLDRIPVENPLFRFLNHCADRLELSEGPQKDDAPFCAEYLVTVGGAYCDGCGKTPEAAGLPCLYKCKKCRLAHYCSESCQARCWTEGHAEYCKQFGHFKVGDEVILENLKSAEDLNGQMVRIQARTSTGRWAVRLLAPEYSKRSAISVKPENIYHPRPLK